MANRENGKSRLSTLLGNLDSILAIAAGITGLILSGLGIISNLILTSVVLSILCILALHEILKSKKEEEGHIELEESLKTIGEIKKGQKLIEKYINEKSSIQLVNPTEDSSIWYGFEEDYCIYDTPARTGVELPFWDIYFKRFENPKLKKAQYLVFMDERGEEKLQWLRKIINNVGKMTETIYEKLEIRTINASAPDYSLYIGKKEGTDCCIMYLPQLDKTGIPEIALIISEKRVILRFRQIFERDWRRGKDITRELFKDESK